jgi:hypothetical protein
MRDGELPEIFVLGSNCLMAKKEFGTVVATEGSLPPNRPSWPVRSDLGLNPEACRSTSVNTKLEGEGILERKTRPSRSSGGEKAFWSITDAGLKYGKNLVSPSNARETQPHWYRSRFNGLMARIGVN